MKSRNLGKFIRKRRLALGMSQSELAQRLGHRLPNFISQMETGKSNFPFFSWKEYADALEVDRGEFLVLVIRKFSPEILDYLELKAKH